MLHAQGLKLSDASLQQELEAPDGIWKTLKSPRSP